MKKLISILLTASMLLGLFAFSFAEETAKKSIDELKVYLYEDFTTGYEEGELEVKSLTGNSMKREMHNGEWVYHPTVPGGYEAIPFSATVKIPEESRPKLVLEYKVSGSLYGGSNVVGWNDGQGIPTVFAGNSVRTDAYDSKDIIASADIGAGITITIVYDNEKYSRDIYIDGKYAATRSMENTTYGKKYVDSGELKVGFYNYIQSATNLYYHYVKIFEAPSDYSKDTFLPSLYKNVGKPSGLLSAISINNDNFYFDMMSALGFINESEYGVYEPDAKMTRLQFASMLSAVLNASPSTEIKGYYNDIALRHFMGGKLEALYEMGVMKGISKTEFGPKVNLELFHAVAAFIRALGYKDMAEYSSGYSAGYMAVANKIGLLKGIDTGAEFTQAAAMKLFYNFLNSEIYEVVGISDKRVTRDTISGNTVLKVYHNIESVIDILTANRSTALDSAEGTGEGAVRIGERVLNTADGTLNAYLGYQVEAYYDAEFDVLLYANITTKNKTAEINADEFVKYQDSKVYYEEGDKEKTYTLSVSMDVVYNGKATPFNKSLFETFRLGKITLIDNNKDNSYDVAIIDSYVNRVVESKSEASEIIKFKNGRGTIAFATYDDYEIRNAQGKNITLADVSNNSVLSIMESADKKYVLVYVGSNSVIGTLESRYSEGNKEIFCIDGKEYVADPDFIADNPMISIGAAAEFNTDVYGIIAGYSEFTGAGEGYAYAMAMKKKGVMDDTVMVKLFTEFKDYGTFDTAEKVKLDGKTVPSAELINSEPLFEKKTVDGSEAYVFVPQLIKYKINDEGKLTSIDTSYYDTGLENGTNTLHKVVKGYMKYDSIDKSFGDDVYLNNGCLIFICPANAENADPDDFFCGTSGLRNESSYSITAYNNSSDTFGTDAILILQNKSDNPSFDSYSYAYVVSGKARVYDAEEEATVTRLSYFYQGSERSLLVDDESLIEGIDVGDVVILDSEDGFLLGKPKHLHDADDPYKIVGGTRGTFWRGAYGYVQAVRENLFKTVQEIPSKDAEGNVTAVTEGDPELHKIPQYIYLVDTKLKKVTIGSPSDIIDRSSDEVNYSKIVFYETRGYDYGLVIYK